MSHKPGTPLMASVAHAKGIEGPQSYSPALRAQDVKDYPAGNGIRTASIGPPSFPVDVGKGTHAAWNLLTLHSKQTHNSLSQLIASTKKWGHPAAAADGGVTS